MTCTEMEIFIGGRILHIELECGSGWKGQGVRTIISFLSEIRAGYSTWFNEAALMHMIKITALVFHLR